ncbi:N-acetyl-gamma-glutamyl-phosphate reductase [Rossellomorea aquimaris]|jgi:N-acetyl-gamma-glutamyl-phosphate reductase|uniref:N-acetyl-gamma-glutamyl-phosphate reductase n=1 Tax=Rossellomorea aquimaris TaxID=189382 RepID=A0A5D4U1X3_9BACI|nr:N-acetyl-gamma-glutamyl-phosphate reductase [Rossellomorea aquimaris]TYS81277.1 N-acetyl-gamma-glutamyl-phosphate reductase [Rossellomorea aquimaris]TYS87899.1 N-acetyl-gamma-glutamyl-phosphate reductase [Rossellomorea aquimaris]
MNVGIVGSTGYGGVELHRLLSNHPNVDDCILYSSSLDGEPYANQYPHLFNLSHEVVNPINIEEMKQLDFVFLAVPSGVSKELSHKLLGEKAKVIDLSGDLRLKEPQEYEEWYKGESASTDILQKAVYGLTECNRQSIQEAELIANPGCFPTATLLGLAPLFHHELIEPHSIIIDAKTGLSGAGRKATQSSHFSETQENLRIYKVHQHQHTPEIEQQLQEWSSEAGPITFTTHLIPMTRGIMATMYTELKSTYITAQLHNIYQDYYEKHPFIRIRPVGQFPSTKEVFGTNFCDIAIKVDSRTNRVTIVSVIDNLLKGAAGQAVQNMNIMLGLDETTGLYHYPIYP